VRVDGAAPEAPLDLVATGFQDPTTDWCPAARALLSSHELGESRLRTATGAGGAFAFRGLPAGETVSVAPRDKTLRVRGQNGFATPSHGVVLELVRIPVIVGRPVRRAKPDPASPPAFEQVTVRMRVMAGARELAGEPASAESILRRRTGNTLEVHDHVAVGSTFRLPVDAPDVRSVEIDIFPNWFGGTKSVPLAHRTVPGPLRGTHDLGDIPLDEGQRTLGVLVVDRAGRPIAGARAWASGVLSARAGADGRIAVPITGSTTSLTVGALGHRLQRAPLPAALPDPFVVTLDKSNRLRIVVTGSVPGPLDGLQVTITLAADFPDDAPEKNGEFAEVHGPVPCGAMWSNAERTHFYQLLPAGTIELCDLPSDVPFEVRLKDRHMHSVFREKLVLGTEETRELRVPQLPPSRTIAARVTDPDGRPIAGATIGLGHWFDQIRTDAEGRFEAKDLYTREPRMRVSAEGFVARELHGEAAFRSEVIVLELARTVWVEVVDGNGTRVDAQPEIAFDDGGRFGGVQRGPGLYQVDGVPLGTGRVCAPEERFEVLGGAELAAEQVRIRVVVRKK
jgi:hypothetical protein